MQWRCGVNVMLENYTFTWIIAIFLLNQVQ